MPKPETLVERMKLLLSLDEDSDVHFLVGEGDDQRLFKAHKIILKSASDVFESMFRFDCENAKNAAVEKTLSTAAPSVSATVVVTDVAPGAFGTMLKFIYEDDLSALDGDNAIELLYAAKKYDIPGLAKACANFRIPNLRNVFFAFAQARLLQENEFALRCLFYIDSNADKLIKSESFLQIDHNLLCEILERDQLRVDKELSIWNAAIRWTDAQCQKVGKECTAENRRITLGPALFKIRFPLISLWDFSKFIVPSRVLTSDELVGVFLFHCYPENRAKSADVYPLQFTTKQRKFFFPASLTEMFSADEQK